MKRTGAVLVAVAVATSSFWLATGGHAVAQPVPTASTRSTAATGCPTTLNKPLTPKRITVQGVTTKAKVIMPKRLAGRVPGDPPLTEAGKEMFAFDKYTGIYPGTPFGVVRMNAHVWPDGSAVGNRMLKNLKIGNRIVVFGLTKKICYRVVDKVVVDATGRCCATTGRRQAAAGHRGLLRQAARPWQLDQAHRLVRQAREVGGRQGVRAPGLLPLDGAGRLAT